MTVKLFKLTLSIVLVAATILSCSKKSETPSNNLDAVSGNWQTTVWGGPNDTARINISSSAATGTIYYLNAGAQTATNFSVNDVILSGITSTGNNTFSATAKYRYNGTGPNTNVGTTTAVLTLQNNNTVLFTHYVPDIATGIAPPDYYWYRP